MSAWYRTPVVTGVACREIQVALSAREAMPYRMLVRRTAIRGRCPVDAPRSYLAGRSRHKRPYSTREEPFEKHQDVAADTGPG